MILHLGLSLLVLVNLAFVHITGVVEATWVLAFCALTAAAPLLRRCTDHLVYRAAWNAVVIVLFASLVERTLSQGVARMLEGGLLLAAFCQVHLVNNVSARQRPDLLLFNSFLIALITSFFCQELAYCAVFVCYAVTLLVVWRLLAHADAVGAAPVAAVVQQGVWHAVLVLGMTAALFLFWPRDFTREGLVGEHLRQAAQAQVGLNEEIDLTGPPAPVQSDRIVMRIHGAGEIPAHWRGCTFPWLERRAWRAATAVQDAPQFAGAAGEQGLDASWREHGHGHWERSATPGAGTLRVELLDGIPARLPLPLDARTLRLSRAAAAVPHLPLADGTFACFADEADAVAGAITYEVERGAMPAPPPAARRRLAGWLGLEPGAVPPEALTMAQEVRAALPRRVAPAALAAALCDLLRAEFTYGLPGHAGSAANLHEFFRDRRGHCEFFASALAMMLRSQGAACRLVGGYLASEREDEDTVVVRARHAHAWVEVWDDARGWCTFDPTPPRDDDARSDTWLGRMRAAAEAAWAAVTGFDAARRTVALRWLADLPARALASPWSLAAAVVLAGWLWRRRRARVPAAVAAYERALRRARLRRGASETPRQVLARAHAMALDPPVLAQLAAATTEHERHRYR